jgi:hypothetical protein
LHYAVTRRGQFDRASSCRPRCFPDVHDLHPTFQKSGKQ